MEPRSPDSFQKIAFVNFGGIGDEILFAPVIEEVCKALPHAHATLFLEDRSRSVRELLPELDSVKTLEIQGQSRIKTFLQLWRMLKGQHFDVVISSGSSPFIPVMLWLTGIPVRVGFQTGFTSKNLLTVEAPLAPRNDRKGYAGQMYFALAQSFLQWLLKEQYTPMDPVLPHLKRPSLEDLHWAKGILRPDESGGKILIHPGVSTISVQKNILKSWSPECWAELIIKLTREGHRVYLAGGPDDKQAIAEICGHLPSQLPGFTDLYGQTKNLRQLAALIVASDLLLCVDSSPMHLAVGYQKPLVAMFGPTDEAKLLPPNDERFQAVTVSDLSCRPCLWDVRNENCDNPVCLNPSVEAMLAATHRALALTSSGAL
jgi:putative inorganic carbon (HCO3(-)) transporter